MQILIHNKSDNYNLKDSTKKLLKYESIISVVKHYIRREINNVKNNIVPNREDITKNTTFTSRTLNEKKNWTPIEFLTHGPWQESNWTHTSQYYKNNYRTTIDCEIFIQNSSSGTREKHTRTSMLTRVVTITLRKFRYTSRSYKKLLTKTCQSRSSLTETNKPTRLL